MDFQVEPVAVSTMDSGVNAIFDEVETGRMDLG